MHTADIGRARARINVSIAIERTEMDRRLMSISSIKDSVKMAWSRAKSNVCSLRGEKCKSPSYFSRKLASGNGACELKRQHRHMSLGTGAENSVLSRWFRHLGLSLFFSSLLGPRFFYAMFSPLMLPPSIRSQIHPAACSTLLVFVSTDWWYSAVDFPEMPF